MSDLKLNPSTYQGSGPPDTATAIEAGVDEIKASFINNAIGAILGVQNTLGNALQLRGSSLDLVARLLVLLEADGKMKNLSAANKTNFPGSVSEGMTGAETFAPNELVRKSGLFDRLESTGLTVGNSGVVATTAVAETFSNKTLDVSTLNSPTIANFVNANHNHSAGAGGGLVGKSGLNFGTGTVVSIQTDPFYYGINEHMTDHVTDKDNASSPAVTVSWGDSGVTGLPTRALVITGCTPAQRCAVTWKYLTASENPSIWALCDDLSGAIIQVWEAEDPIDLNAIDQPPFVAGEGQTMVRVTNDISSPSVVNLALAQVQGRDGFADLREMMEREFTHRDKWGKEDLTDIRGIESIQGITPEQKLWRHQVYLRGMAKVIRGSQRESSFGKFLAETFKIDKNKRLVNL